MDDPTHLRAAIAARLRQAREQAGLSQGQTAKLLCKHRPTITEVEAGRRRVSAEELVVFAELYRVSPAWLMGDREEGSFPSDIAIAARQLERLKPDDRDRVINFLQSLPSSEDKTS